MVNVLKAIADENRFWIMRLLLQKQHCVRALSRKLGISEPAISQHLKVLKDAGLVTGKKVGYYMHYRVNKERIGEVIALLEDLMATEPINQVNICFHEEE